MARGKRPIRGGKQVGDRRHSRFQKPIKQKKGKFNLREASYVKERDAKNAEIENRRRILAEKEIKKRKYESESSEEEEEENYMETLLSTFSKISQKRNRIAIESESEPESEEDEEKIEELKPEEENSIDEGINGEEIKEDEQIDNEDTEETIQVQIKEGDEEDDETAREDAGIINDPFAIHLNHDLSDELHSIISSKNPSVEVQELKWPVLGKITAQIPKINDENSSSKPVKSILDDRKFAKPGEIPQIIDKVDWDKLYVKTQIKNNLTRANYSNIKDDLEKNPSALTPLQKELFTIMNNYQDLLYCERTFSNEDQIRFTYCLHAVNHLMKTRTKILHHNAKLSKSNKSSMGEVPDEYRDQGLVRPKVLILVPFRHSCLKIVELLIAILIGEDKGGSVVNKNRFLEDFGGRGIRMPKMNPKPEDYEKTFSGNIDCGFIIGISITKKTLKLYSEFYSSDIIISSVVGLRKIVLAEGEEGRDYDFLASIELLIMDQAELFYMQNWDNLIHVLNHLHLQPKKPHDTDFSRVRSWSANGWSKYYRQTLIFSGIQLPEINAIFNRRCHNYAGKFKVLNPCTDGTFCQVVVQIPQDFYKFNAENHMEAFEARLNFFKKKILPEYKKSTMNHTLIFVPSYFDFVKLRNHFMREELKSVRISEYIDDDIVAKARDMFFHSSANFSIYSERYHFFRRIKIKGIRHLIFFAPPTFPHFYSEMCNLMLEGYQNPKAGTESNMTITTLFSKFDIMQLSAIVGSKKAEKWIWSDKDEHRDELVDDKNIKFILRSKRV